jgi:MFS family permease
MTFLALPESHALSSLDANGRLLFSTRAVRMFAFGALSVVLALYLEEKGFSEGQIGLLLTLTLAGDAAISLWISSIADRIGRKKMLMLGAILMGAAGLVFALTGNFVLLTLAAIIGTISPSGNEVGPFLALEQSAMSEKLPSSSRTAVFAWYNLVGSLATALGALSGGVLAQVLQGAGHTPLESYRAVVMLYAALGAVLWLLFSRISSAAEVAPIPATSSAKTSLTLGLHQSRGIIFKLSSLFALDAFAGGLVIQSLMALWFQQRYGVNPATLGAIFFGANLFAGFSALAAARVAARFGLINTMVWTHVPSNILLILVPLMPNLPLAIVVLLARFSISQMDVPTRQSYVMAVVTPDERSAAAGVTGIARTIGASLAPALVGVLGVSSLAFFLAGGLKIVYDLVLYRSFVSLEPGEEA